MSDTAAFVVKLVDRLTAPGRAMSHAVDGISKSLKKTGQLSDLTQGQLKQLFSHKIGEGVDHALTFITDGLLDIAKNATLAAGALGIVVATIVTKGVVGMGIFADASRRALSFLTGNGQAANYAFERSIKIAKEFGMDVEDVTHTMEKMLALQFTMGEAQTFIKLSADLKAVGASADAVQRVLMGITHIKAVGMLQGRELRSLATAGVSVQLIFEEIGKAMGVATDKVHGLIGKHKVTADIALPAIQRAIMRKTHEHAPGEAGKSFAQNTLSGTLDRLKNAPQQLFLRAAEAGTKGFEKLRQVLDSIIVRIDTMDGNKFADFALRVVTLFEKAVPLAFEFADGFSEGFGEVLKGLEAGNVGVSDLKTARDLGRTLAQSFGFALSLARDLGKAISWLTSETGRSVLKWGGVAFVIAKVIGLIGDARKAMMFFAGVEVAEGLSSTAAGVGAIGTAFAGIQAGALAAGSWIQGAFFAGIRSVTLLYATVGLWPFVIGAAFGLAIYEIYKHWDDIVAYGGNAGYDMIQNFKNGIKRALGFGPTVDDLFEQSRTSGRGTNAALVGGRGNGDEAPRATLASYGARGQRGPSVFSPKVTVHLHGADLQSHEPSEIGQTVGDHVSKAMESFWQDAAAGAGG